MIGQTALESDRADVLAWMRDVGCCAMLTPDDEQLTEAVASGEIAVARWLLATITDRPLCLRYIGSALTRAASAGHTATVAFAHNELMVDCPCEVLVRAARYGHVNLLRWAAGEHVEGVPHAGARSLALPELSHWASAAAWNATEYDRPNVISWLLDRASTRRFVTVGVARRALGRGHTGIALAIHQSGVAPFDQWPALGVASRMGCDVVRAVVEHGAPYDPSALVVAIKHGSIPTMAYLCAHYGTGDLQRAVDLSASHSCSRGMAAWLRKQFGWLCVAEVQAGEWVRNGVATCVWVTRVGAPIDARRHPIARAPSLFECPFSIDSSVPPSLTVLYVQDIPTRTHCHGKISAQSA